MRQDVRTPHHLYESTAAYRGVPATASSWSPSRTTTLPGTSSTRSPPSLSTSRSGEDQGAAPGRRRRKRAGTWRSARQILHIAEPHFAQAPTSINHNEIMNRFHLEGHGVAPHLPLTATETQANTQDPGALRLPRLPFHPIALRLTRATNAHPLHPAALAFVSYGIVLVQFQVQVPLQKIGFVPLEKIDLKWHKIETKPRLII